MGPTGAEGLFATFPGTWKFIYFGAQASTCGLELLPCSPPDRGDRVLGLQEVTDCLGHQAPRSCPSRGWAAGHPECMTPAAAEGCLHAVTLK